ncbi:MAG: rod shape-determining protein MreC [Treponema sp.]|jgi:rod shape-determining protein MreC|nr:rod shape-determining protein MreC [Treponema sp.]
MPIGDYKRKRRFTAEAYVFIALALVSFSALLVSTRSFIVNFRDMGLSLFSGARGSIHGVASFVSDVVLAVRELAVLRREYAELTERMARYEQLERTAADIRQENSRLREQLGFAETLAAAHIPARIIGRDPDNLFSALVINKGRRDGLENDMPVVAFQNGMEALMGKVSQTGALESLALPVYDVNFFISARFSDSRYEGLVEGQGDREAPLLMKNIPKRAREEINYGDLVVSSGLGGVYPPGIAIGRVVRFQEYENSMTVELESVITFSRLEYVFVIDVESADG